MSPSRTERARRSPSARLYSGVPVSCGQGPSGPVWAAEVGRVVGLGTLAWAKVVSVEGGGNDGPAERSSVLVVLGPVRGAGAAQGGVLSSRRRAGVLGDGVV